MDEQKNQEERFIFEEETVEIRTMEKDIAKLKAQGGDVFTGEKKIVPKKFKPKEELKKENSEDVEKKKKTDRFVEELKEEMKNKSEEGEEATHPTKEESAKEGVITEEDFKSSLSKEINLATQEEVEKKFSISLLAIPEEGGIVMGDGLYARGLKINVIAKPNEGFEFKGWIEEGNIVSEEPAYSIELNRDVTLAAKFEKKKEEVDSLTPTEEDIKDVLSLIAEEEAKKKAEEEAQKKEAREEEEERIKIEEAKIREEKERKRKEEEESEEKMFGKIAELEKEQKEMTATKKELETKKRELEEERSSLQSSLNEVLKRESEIENKEREIESETKNPKKEKVVKKDLWGWQEKRRLVEKERWDWDEKILKISAMIRDVERDREKIEDLEKENQMSLEDVRSKIEKMRLEKEKKELEKELTDIFIAKENKEKRLDKVRKEKQDTEHSLNIVNEKIGELIELKKEIENREAIESDPLLKKKVEKERWNVEDDIKTIEERKWVEEGKLREIMERERRAEQDRSEIESRKNQLKKRIDEIETAMEGGNNSLVDKKEEKTEKDSDEEAVKRYILENSGNPSEDIEKADRDILFFKYILKRAKQS